MCNRCRQGVLIEAVRRVMPKVAYKGIPILLSCVLPSYIVQTIKLFM